MTVLTKPATIVAMAPMPEYRFQKKESKIAGDSVQPIPAHAQLTMKYTSDSDVIASTKPSNPAMTTTARESATSRFSDRRRRSERRTMSSLMALVITSSCESAVVTMAAKMPDKSTPASHGGNKIVCPCAPNRFAK